MREAELGQEGSDSNKRVGLGGDEACCDAYCDAQTHTELGWRCWGSSEQGGTYLCGEGTVL